MEVNRQKVLGLQRAYVEAMRERREAYVVTHAGLEFVVLPGVFPPYLDSSLVVRAMRVEPEDVVLDVGSGTGVIAVFAARRARRVTATDINPAAVETIRANALRHGLEDRLTAVEADLFPPAGRAAFDVVTFNPPYSDHPAIDMPERSVWDPGHAAVRRFFAGVAGVLRPGGRVYLGWADFADLDFIEGLMAQQGFGFQLIDEARDDTSRFVVYEARPSSR